MSFEFFDIFTNFVPVIISTGFMLFGIALLLFDSLYKKDTVKAEGTIEAIEKYVSRSRTNNRSSTQLMYRPIVSFTYDSKKTYFGSSLGKSNITDKIGDKVIVEYLKSLPSSVRIAGRKFVRNFGMVLFLISLILLYIANYSDDLMLVVKVIRVIIPVSINLVLFLQVSKFIEKHGGISELMKSNNPIITKEEMNALDLLWTKNEIEAEVSRTLKPFLYITPVLISLAGWPAYVFGKKFFAISYVAKNFNHNLFDIEKAKVFFSFIWGNSNYQKTFMIFAISSFFFILLMYSYIFTLKRTK